MGKREEQKKHYHNTILSAAGELFSEKGYDDTTMEQIAEKADVGLGTAYNYFKSKDELYILTMAESITESIKDDASEIESYDESVQKIVADAVLKQVKRFNVINKRTWKTILPIILNSLGSNSKMMNILLKADLKVLDTMRSLFNNLKQKGRLPDDFDSDTVVELIFGNVYLNLTMYLYTEELTFDTVCKKIEKSIYLLLDNSKKEAS